MKTVISALTALVLFAPCLAWAQEFPALQDCSPQRQVQNFPQLQNFPQFPELQELPNGDPLIRLDKSRFAAGESVFFWVGVYATNHDTIPEAYWNTCRLTITRPDGIQETQAIAWPVDGMIDRGWEGGSGLFEKPQPGTYQLEFEFAGKKTALVPLVVEDLPIIKKIKADFVFGTAAKSSAAEDIPVTFTVINHSNQTVRFSHRDGVNGLVWVTLRKMDKSYESDFLYPAKELLDQDEPALPNQDYENFTWKMAQMVPTITLAPGETYRQKLSLIAALKEAAPNVPLTQGRYSVTFETNLQLLIGEPNSSIAAFSPVHLPVTASVDYNVVP